MITIDGSYSSVSFKYRNNPNPVTNCGHIINDCYTLCRLPFYKFSLLEYLDNIYGEFYHIDPTSIFSIECPYMRGYEIGFKAKSRIKPYAIELSEYHTECLMYWIDSLQTAI